MAKKMVLEQKEAQVANQDSQIKKVEQLQIERSGRKFIMPEGLGFDEAIAILERQRKYEEEKTEIYEPIDGFLLDAMLAFDDAMRHVFGWSTAEPIKTLFGENPPKLISVEVGPNETRLAPWGQFSLPGIDGYVQTGIHQKNGMYILQIQAVVKRKNEPKIRELVAVTRQFVKERSVYRGKAIKIRFRDNDGDLLSMPEPKFLDLSKVRESDIMFSEDVDAAIATSLYTPIDNPDACRAAGIPLKRGILLCGPYGTGKTLTAYVAASKCLRSGWTFLYCERADELDDMVKLAHQYQPAVVFCEDIDRSVSGERSAAMDDILNIIDGIESKTTEIMVVLTTNHVENINRAMLRPGRLDAVINVLPPDAQTVERLLRLYGRGLIAETENLASVGKELAGKIPAVIRECIERAKLAAIKFSQPGEKLQVTEKALLEAAHGMRMQLDLLEGRKKIVKDSELAGIAFGKFVTDTIDRHGLVANGVAS